MSWLFKKKKKRISNETQKTSNKTQAIINCNNKIGPEGTWLKNRDGDFQTCVKNELKILKKKDQEKKEEEKRAKRKKAKKSTFQKKFVSTKINKTNLISAEDNQIIESIKTHFAAKTKNGKIKTVNKRTVTTFVKSLDYDKDLKKKFIKEHLTEKKINRFLTKIKDEQQRISKSNKKKPRQRFLHALKF